MARFISDVVGLRAALDSKASASDVQNVDAKLEKKAEKVHGHSLREIAGLILALAGKAPINHRHDAATVTFSPVDPSDWDGTPGAVSGALNQLSERLTDVEESGPSGPGSSVLHIDGGAPDSIYTAEQVIDGGGP